MGWRGSLGCVGNLREHWGNGHSHCQSQGCDPSIHGSPHEALAIPPSCQRRLSSRGAREGDRRDLTWPAVLAACLCAGSAGAQERADPALLAEIGRIRAIDHHSHADPAFPPGDEPQEAKGAPPFAYPLRLRLENPEYAEAWRALWGEASAGSDPDQLAVLRAKWRARKERADGYPSWVLDQAGIDVVLVDTERLGPGQAPPRFRWVAPADELLFPLESERPRFRRILAACGLTAQPATLAEYATRVLTPTLERWKAEGALAVKLVVAYRRALDFAAAARWRMPSASTCARSPEPRRPPGRAPEAPGLPLPAPGGRGGPRGPRRPHPYRRGSRSLLRRLGFAARLARAGA